MADPDPNPYAAPSDAAQVSAPGVRPTSNVDFERRRRELATAERDVLIAGSLILCAGILLSAFALIRVSYAQNFMGSVTVLLLMAGAGLRLFAAILLWRLNPLGRVLHLAAIGVLVVHGVLFETWMGGAPDRLWMRLVGPALVVASLWRKQSSQVFECHYVEKVVPATPHVRVRDGWFWLAHALIVVFGLGTFAVVAVKLGWLSA